MKSKKSLLLMAFSLIFALSVCLFYNNSFSAKADALANVDGVFGVTYNTEYLLEKAGCEKLEGQNTLKGGRTVKYKAEGAQEETEADDKIKLTKKGGYVFTTFVGETAEHTFTVNAIDKALVGVDSLSYATEATVLEEYKDEISKVVNPDNEVFNTNNSFTLPAMDKILKSDYFEFADLSKTIYYAGPQATTYASTTSSKFSLNSAGHYSFYVLATDPLDNKMSVEDLTEKADGWYNDANELVVPIFSFEVNKIAAPEISVLTSENGYIGLEYTVECFTVKANNYTSDYKLYYSEEYFDKDDEAYASDVDYIKAVTESAAVTDVTDEYLNVSTLKFSPDKKGYYYVLLNVGDENGFSDTALSRAISVQSEYTTYSVESEWFKYNKTSIIFFGIAVVCFVAFIVVIFIKPKDYDVKLDMKK